MGAWISGGRGTTGPRGARGSSGAPVERAREGAAGLALAAAALVAVCLVILGCVTPAPSGAEHGAGASSTSSPGATVDGTGPASTADPTTVPTTVRSAGPAADEDDLVVEVVAEGLEVPWEIRFLPDGALVVTERSGNILHVDPASGAMTELGRLPVAQTGEAGLMGLAVDPGYPDRPYLYVSYSYRGPDAGSEIANRVSRLTVGGRPTSLSVGEERVLVDGIPGAGVHDGSRVAFGPDGNLWVTTGDAAQPGLAQDLRSLAGKVLRMDREGRPPADDPLGAGLVHSYGHRNPQGLAWRSGDPEPFVTEHGPSEDDEVNHIRAGGDFGWPVQGGPRYVGPVHGWTPTIAPAGAVFYESPVIPGWEGSFLLVTLKEADLRRLVPADEFFDDVAEEHVLFDGRFGRLRSIAVGPDGALYVGTSNRDGRGRPSASDDRILRITVR